MKINLNEIVKIALEVCQETLVGLEDVTEKMRLVMKVVMMVMLRKELEIEPATGARDLAEKLLADDVLARLNPDAVSE